jgi:dimethylargininase
MPRWRAITREVSRSLADCELTYIAREPIDVERARRQHGEYEAALERLGCTVERLGEEPALPDAVFVDDTALVLDEVAVIFRPGAPSRRPETESVASALAPYRELLRMTGLGTTDGGDVLHLARTLYVGLSTRSDLAGIDELRELVAPYGYLVHGTPISGCLHLKSAVTAIGEDTILVNPDWVDAELFPGTRAVEIDRAEPLAANALRIGGRLIYSATCPRTAEKLARLGFDLELVDLSELDKAEGAVTCCSLLFGA